MNVKVDKSGPLTTVTINRPDARNAVDRPTSEALAAAFREFDQDDSARVAILTGADGNFCAGADLKAVASGQRRNRIDAQGDGPMGPSRMQLSKPVIAAVSGYAVAGGLELACWADLRVADETAVFGVFCRRWGVPLIDGGTVRLPRIIGAGRAMEMILTGREIAAQKALDWGLVNWLVPNGQALDKATEIATALAQFPQDCMRHDRLSATQQWSLDENAALANEFSHGLQSIEQAAAGAGRFSAGEGRHGGFSD